MSEFTGLIVEAHRETLRFIGAKYQIGNVEFDAVPGEDRQSNSPDISGFDPGNDLILTVESALLASVPELIGSVVTAVDGGRQYRVSETLNSGTGLVDLILEAVAQSG